MDFIELTKQLITIQSTQDRAESIKKTLMLLEKELAEYKIERFEKNGSPSLLVYNTSKRPGKFRVILNGHLDVVHGDTKQFLPQQKGDKLYGRGAIDMKGSVAVMAIAFKRMAKELKEPIALQLVTDEEVGGFNGTKHQIEAGVTADFVIIGEPTDLNIEVAAKGILWLELQTKGKNAHGAYPWLGENAISKMSGVIGGLNKLFPVPEAEAWRTTCNIANIQGGESTNQVPDRCTLRLDIRRVPEDTTDEIVNKVKTIKKDLEVKVLLDEPCHHIEVKNGVLRKLEAAITKYHKKPQHLKKHGGSDARHYAGDGIPAICFGPVGGDLHGPDEWVSLKSLEKQYEILCDFMAGLR